MLRVSEGQGTRLPKTRAAQRSTLTSVVQFLGKHTHIQRLSSKKLTIIRLVIVLKFETSNLSAYIIQMVYRS